MQKAMQACALLLLIVLLLMSAALCMFLPTTKRGVGLLEPAAPEGRIGISSLRGSSYVTCGDHLSLDTKGFHLLKALCFEPANILDIGANRGDWTAEFRGLFPNAFFLMLDGNNYTASKTWRHIRQAGGGQVDQDSVLLGKQEGEMQWFSQGLGDTGASIYREMSGNQKKAEVRRIETLDNFLQRTGRNMRFDFVKLDVQGAELDILSGAAETLKSVEVLLLEMPVAGVYNENAPSFSAYIAALDAAGFAVFDMTEQHRLTEAFTWWGNAGFLVQVDFIFVRKASNYLRLAQQAIATIDTPEQRKQVRPYWYYQVRLSERWLVILRASCGVNIIIIFIFFVVPFSSSLLSGAKVRAS